MDDERAQQAREQHQCAEQACKFAAVHRQQRDQLVRTLRAEGWSYGRLAKAVGCSVRLVRRILESEEVTS